MIKKQASTPRRKGFFMRRQVKRVLRPIFVLMVVCSCLLFASCWYLAENLPSNISYTDSADMTIAGIFPVKAVKTGKAFSVAKNEVQNFEEYNAELRLFGIFPIANATVTKVPEMYVQVLGNPFGIKIYSDGVMIVGMSAVDTENGNSCPAKNAGLQIGDVIVAIGGKKAVSNADVSKAAENSNGDSLSVTVIRNGNELTVWLKPELSRSEKKHKLGLWVRDSSAGVGTLTFYDPSSGILAGLGHGITDSSTRELVPAAKGQLVGAEVVGLQKSVSGDPGELHGRFTLSLLGNLLLNSECGVYGTSKSVFATDRLYPVAMKQEVKTGEATVITTVSGGSPKSYSCKIEKIYFSASEESQDMIIRITDPELLSETGGIVQGMSGSPIIQNGKLIGAVTHVFVNNPEKGYAVFAEDMLETAQQISNKAKKEAS